MPIVTSCDMPLEIGKAQRLRSGRDLCIVATGIMTPLALEAAEQLASGGIEASVLNIHTIKPLDTDTITSETLGCGGRILVCEEANRFGGIGEAASYALLGKEGIKMAHVAVDDRFGQSGQTAELLAEYGITAANIVSKAKSLF